MPEVNFIGDLHTCSFDIQTIYTVCVIVQIIFRYYTDTFWIFGLYMHNMKRKQNSIGLDYHSNCNDLLCHFFFTIVMVQCVVECVLKNTACFLSKKMLYSK